MTQTDYPSAVNTAAHNEADLFAVCSANGEGAPADTFYAMDYLNRFNDRVRFEDEPEWNRLLETYLKKLNQSVYFDAEHTRQEASVSTVVLGLDGEKIYGAGVGSCAAYILRNGKLTELTASFDKKARLGISKDCPELFFMENLALESGDRLLLINGEAGSLVGDERLMQLMQSEGNIDDRVKAVIKAALDAGAREYITAVFISVDGVGSESFIAGKKGRRLIVFLIILLLLVIAAGLVLWSALENGNGVPELPI